MSIGFLNPLMRRRLIKAPVNPLDRATVVSIYPKPIVEHKVTIQPGVFVIPAGSPENPSFLTVGPSSWWKEVDEEQPLLEIPNSSIQIADSLVKDYCNGVPACDMSTRMPGLFFVPGTVDFKELKERHGQLLVNAITRQKNWFIALISMADTLWARSNGNPVVISDDMRLAARLSNLVDKDWMKDFKMVANVSCVACGQPRNPLFPVCPNCHAITDIKKAEELGIVFAKVK